LGNYLGDSGHDLSCCAYHSLFEHHAEQYKNAQEHQYFAEQIISILVQVALDQGVHLHKSITEDDHGKGYSDDSWDVGRGMVLGKIQKFFH